MIMINTSNVLIYLVVERKGWNRGGSLSPVPPLVNLPTIHIYGFTDFVNLHLVLMLSHHLALLEKFLAIDNTAVPTFLFYFHPAECGVNCRGEYKAQMFEI